MNMNKKEHDDNEIYRAQKASNGGLDTLKISTGPEEVGPAVWLSFLIRALQWLVLQLTCRIPTQTTEKKLSRKGKCVLIYVT